jgi:hypothetical protein
MTLAALLLAGCAGYSPECVTGTGTKDCAPGTMGHQQMMQEREGDETVASIDDALPRLRGTGFKRLSRVPAARSQIAGRRPITTGNLA